MKLQSVDDRYDQLKLEGLEFPSVSRFLTSWRLILKDMEKLEVPHAPKRLFRDFSRKVGSEFWEKLRLAKVLNTRKDGTCELTYISTWEEAAVELSQIRLCATIKALDASLAEKSKKNGELVKQFRRAGNRAVWQETGDGAVASPGDGSRLWEAVVMESSASPSVSCEANKVPVSGKGVARKRRRRRSRKSREGQESMT